MPKKTLQVYNSNCWYKEVCQGYGEGCENNCIRYLEMSYLMEHSGIPKNRQKPIMLEPTVSDLDTFYRLNDIKNDIVNFVNEGKSLYISSEITGNGKTSWAIKIMLKFFDSVWCGNGFNVRGLFIHVPTFLLRCKDFKTTNTEFEELKRILPEVDLVIFDDIASTDLSAYDFSQLLMYIDVRCSAGKSNIYTGNITDRDELQRALGAKLTSRVLGGETEQAVFYGFDRR